MTFNLHYIDWNHRRIKKIIAHFGHEAFFEKTVLDLGCGHADQSGALARLGARVIAVDVRQEHLTIAKRKYPHINTICADLDSKWPFVNQHFDFVLCLGIVCHLTNYRQLLQKACGVATNLILESEICDSEDPDRVIQTDEHRSIYDWAFNGVGHKPSASNLEYILRDNGMSFRRYDTPDLNSGPFKYDWAVSHSGNRKIGHRRFWIASKDGHSQIITSAVSHSPQITIPTINPVPLTIRPEIVISGQAANPKKEGFRTAVCISGYLRCFEQTFDRLFNNLLKTTNPDIFIHTWDFMGAPLRSFDTPLIRVSAHSYLPRINKLYKPTKIVIEPAIHFPIPPIMHQRNTERRDINGILSMFYKMKACNQLKIDAENQHNFKYDCVIRLRSDLMFMSPFYINNSMDTNKIYIPNGYDYEGINDQVAYGSSDLINKYCAAFDKLSKYLLEGEKFNPERLLKSHLIKSELPVERCNMHYYIKRVL